VIGSSGVIAVIGKAKLEGKSDPHPQKVRVRDYRKEFGLGGGVGRLKRTNVGRKPFNATLERKLWNQA
jgi:hypothetical protein